MINTSSAFRAGWFPLATLAIIAVSLAGLATPASAKKPGPPVTAPFCGNGVIEADRGESCDGSNLGEASCASLGTGFTGGTLSCGSNCQYVTGACTTCGNGTLETGEACEGDNLQGHTCQSETGFGFGTLACNGTCDAFDTTGCSRYDSDFFTVTDSVTGLMWQRTTDTANDGIRDKDRKYTWSATQDVEPSGTVFTEFLSTLNGLPLHTYQGCSANDPADPNDLSCSRNDYCFAGYCDWRLPESHELLSIIDASQGDPRIDQSLFGPTSTDPYWTATRGALRCFFPNFTPNPIWALDFDSGNTLCQESSASRPARAVRYVGGHNPLF